MGPEPITSILRRELIIAAAASGKLSRCFDEMARALRKHLQPELDCAKDGYQQGEVGSEASVRSGKPATSGPDDPFQANLWESYD